MNLRVWDGDAIDAWDFYPNDYWRLVNEQGELSGFAFVCPVEWLPDVYHRHFTHFKRFPVGWELDGDIPINSPTFLCQKSLREVGVQWHVKNKNIEVL